MLKKYSLLIAFILIVFFLLFTVSFQKEPKVFVKNKTEKYTENLFFKKQIIKYPVIGSVVNTTLGEENKTIIPIGIAADSSEINFGRTAVTTVVKKILNLKNRESIPVKFHLRAYGNISRFMNFEKDFVLNAGETKKIEVKFNAAQTGNYTGEFDITVLVPKHPILTVLLPLV